jgi:hypothetical protein
MNERIKELMLEAGYAAPEIAGRARKFKDLLIDDVLNELADISGAIKLHDPEDENGVELCKIIQERIKNKFGATSE